jgi:hypothetical protein
MFSGGTVSALARLTAIAVLALCASGVAGAAEVGGVKLDDKVSIDGHELVLNGAGIRTKVFLRIYVLGLYLPQPAKDVPAVFAKAPRRIQMNMLRTLSADQIVDALLDTMQDNNTPAELAAVERQELRNRPWRSLQPSAHQDLARRETRAGGSQDDAARRLARRRRQPAAL